MPCVYFIRKGEKDVYKVGMSSINAESRLGSLQTGNEELLTLCATIECPSAHTANEIEKYLHETFWTYRLHGEWFNLTWNDILSTLRYYEQQDYETAILSVRSRSKARFSAGTNGRVKDKDSVTLQRALQRLAAVEKANNELIENRIAWLRQEVGREVRAEYYPEIKITEREIDLRDREIIRLQKEVNRLTRLARPSLWARFVQLFQQKVRA